MLFTAFFWWWFGNGWRRQVSGAAETLARVTDFFSIKLLFRTLFSPFRQISAGRVKGSLGVMFRAWVDKTVSRFIGAIVRLIIIVVGLVSLLLSLILVGLRIILWPLLPLLPIVFIYFALVGFSL